MNQILRQKLTQLKVVDKIKELLKATFFCRQFGRAQAIFFEFRLNKLRFSNSKQTHHLYMCFC